MRAQVLVDLVLRSSSSSSSSSSTITTTTTTTTNNNNNNKIILFCFQTSVSLKRLNHFFQLDELDSEAVEWREEPEAGQHILSWNFKLYE